jgi:hypothetical protein
MDRARQIVFCVRCANTSEARSNDTAQRWVVPEPTGPSMQFEHSSLDKSLSPQLLMTAPNYPQH